MKFQLEDGDSITVIHPEGPNDSLTIVIAKNDQSKGMVLMNANQAAHFIRDLNRAFSGFTGTA